jgi:hypothetical protein
MKRRLPTGGWRGIASVIAPVCIGVLLAYGWTAAATHVTAAPTATNIGRVHVTPAADQTPAPAVPAVSTEEPLPAGVGRPLQGHAPHRAARHRLRTDPYRLAFTYPERKDGARPVRPGRGPAVISARVSGPRAASRSATLPAGTGGGPGR